MKNEEWHDTWYKDVYKSYIVTYSIIHHTIHHTLRTGEKTVTYNERSFMLLRFLHPDGRQQFHHFLYIEVFHISSTHLFWKLSTLPPLTPNFCFCSTWHGVPRPLKGSRGIFSTWAARPRKFRHWTPMPRRGVWLTMQTSRLSPIIIILIVIVLDSISMWSTGLTSITDQTSQVLSLVRCWDFNWPAVPSSRWHQFLLASLVQ